MPEKFEGIKVEKKEGKIEAKVATDVVTATAMVAVAVKEISRVAGISEDKVLEAAASALKGQKEKPEVIQLILRI